MEKHASTQTDPRAHRMFEAHRFPPLLSFEGIYKVLGAAAVEMKYGNEGRIQNTIVQKPKHNVR